MIYNNNCDFERVYAVMTQTTAKLVCVPVLSIHVSRKTAMIIELL